MTRIALVQQHASADKKANVERGVKALRDRSGERCGAYLLPGASFRAILPAVPGGKRDPAACRAGARADNRYVRPPCRQLGVVVVLNLFERDGERCYDTSPVIDADGCLLGRTRMIHITDYPSFHEQDYYTPGNTGTPFTARESGASVWPSATIGTSPSTCGHWPSVAHIWYLCPRRVRSVSGRRDCTRRKCAWRHSRTGTTLRPCNRVGTDEGAHLGGESFICTPEGTILARHSGRGPHPGCRHGPEHDWTLPMRGVFSCNTGGRSFTRLAGAGTQPRPGRVVTFGGPIPSNERRITREALPPPPFPMHRRSALSIIAAACCPAPSRSEGRSSMRPRIVSAALTFGPLSAAGTSPKEMTTVELVRQARPSIVRIEVAGTIVAEHNAAEKSTLGLAVQVSSSMPMDTSLRTPTSSCRCWDPGKPLPS